MAFEGSVNVSGEDGLSLAVLGVDCSVGDGGVHKFDYVLVQLVVNGFSTDSLATGSTADSFELSVGNVVCGIAALSVTLGSAFAESLTAFSESACFSFSCCVGCHLDLYE